MYKTNMLYALIHAGLIGIGYITIIKLEVGSKTYNKQNSIIIPSNKIDTNTNIDIMIDDTTNKNANSKQKTLFYDDQYSPLGPLGPL